jgi:cytochrome P450
MHQDFGDGHPHPSGAVSGSTRMQRAIIAEVANDGGEDGRCRVSIAKVARWRGRAAVAKNAVAAGGSPGHLGGVEKQGIGDVLDGAGGGPVGRQRDRVPARVVIRDGSQRVKRRSRLHHVVRHRVHPLMVPAAYAAGVTGAMDGVDLTDLDLFAGGFPHQVFQQHRREAPVYWHEPTPHTPDSEGFWTVATYAETRQVLRDPDTYSSERGGDREYGGTLLADLPVAGIVLNMMDDPRHARVRRLVSTGLTRRMVEKLEVELRRRTKVLLAAIDDEVPFDLVHDLAGELPLQTICILLGVPEQDRHRLLASVEHTFDIRVGDAPDSSVQQANLIRNGQQQMLAYAGELLASKRAHPTDDMLSIVVHAKLEDVEPPQLTEAELYSFFLLLFAAGAETTRGAVSAGMLALLERPDELQLLRDDRSLLPTAVEEILRWTSPSPSKRRTATVDTELAGHHVERGQKVLVWEASANRDESAFAAADTFDIRRSPNPHLAFGSGVHFCLGANLARLEIRLLLDEMLEHFSEIEQASAPEWTRSNRHTGVRKLMITGRR